MKSVKVAGGVRVISVGIRKNNPGGVCGLAGFLISFIVIFGSIAPFASTDVSADGGWIPFYEFSAYEPGQKAICAWDGIEEIMILSVDVYGAENGKVLHFVPFPSLPEVTLGNVSSFEKVNHLLGNYIQHRGDSGSGSNDGTGLGGKEGVEIEFHEKIGAHNITVVSVNSFSEFMEWVNDFLNSNYYSQTDPFIPSNLDTVISHYLNQNISYFAFDVIEVSTEENSVDPLVYRFETDYLFFPLVISSVVEGTSEIELVTITPEDIEINSECNREIGLDYYMEFDVTHKDLTEISPEIGKLISTNGVLTYFTDILTLSELDADVKMNEISNLIWRFKDNKHIKKTMIFDCNSDGYEDVIVFTYNEIFSVSGKNGGILWQNTDNAYHIVEDTQFLLYDVDSDGTMEIILITQDYSKFKIFVIRTDNGKQVWTYEAERSNHYHTRIIPKIADVDGDGDDDLIVHFDYSRICAINLDDGAVLWSESSYGQLRDFIIKDVNNDNKPEVIGLLNDLIFALNGRLGYELWSWQSDGSIYGKSSYNIEQVIADFDSNGKEDLLVANGDKLSMLELDSGTLIWEFESLEPQDSSKITPEFTFTDYNYDGALDIFYGIGDLIYSIDSKTGKKLWKTSNLQNDYSKGEKSFVIQDINLDNIRDLIYCLDSSIYAINAETGNILWYNNFNFISEYSSVTIPTIKYYFQKDKVEVICNFEYRLYCIDGKSGDTKWEYYNEDTISTLTSVLDLDNDNKDEIIAYTDNTVYMLNIDDGTASWEFFIGKDKELREIDCFDFNSDGDKDIVIQDDIKLFVLNPVTGNPLWEFSNGHNINTYETSQSGSEQDQNVVVTYAHKIYNLDYNELTMEVIADPTEVEVGDAVNFIVKTYYNGAFIPNIKLKISDSVKQGDFSEITQLSNGVFAFDYTVPKTDEKIITISIEALSDEYFGVVEDVDLKIIDNVDVQPERDVLIVSPMAIPPEIRPGEKAFIIFDVSDGKNNIVEGLAISLFDGNSDGVFSQLQYKGNYNFMFNYTSSYTVSEPITIYILVEHEDYEDGLGIVKLDIIIEDPSSGEDIPDEEKDLDVSLTVYPVNSSPGEQARLTIGITDDSQPVLDAEIFPYTNIIGGSFSDIEYEENGNYVLLYDLPAEIDDAIKTITIFLHISHDEYPDTYKEVIIDILHREEASDPDLCADLNFDFTPKKAYPGSKIILVLWLTNTSPNLITNDVNIIMTDNNIGGIFEFRSKDNQGRFVYDYTVPMMVSGTIKISAKAITNGEILDSSEIRIELNKEPAASKTDEQESKEEIKKLTSYYNISLILIIFIIGILLGLYGNVIKKKMNFIIIKKGK